MKINGPIKWHGGKHYLAPKIVALMPRHTHYVEPYAGGLAVLLVKNPEGVSEVANDVDGRLTNFWRCLICPPAFEDFFAWAQRVPFCEAVWEQALRRLETPCERPGVICSGCAQAFFIACRQSLAGRMDTFAPLSKTRTRRGMNEQASAWLTAIEGLPAVHTRLKRVVVLNRHAPDVILQQDGPDTLFYLDPPYLHETRRSTDAYGPCEMTEDGHRELLGLVQSVKGKVMLSGYPSPLYDTLLSRWTRHTFELPNNAAGGKKKARMTEVLWCNF